jgi:hypothetical protein
VRVSFQVKVCDAGMCIAILRIASDAVDFITSSLPFVLSIGSSDAVLRLLGEGKFRENVCSLVTNLYFLLLFQTRNYSICLLLGSSMRTVEKRLIDFNLRTMYAQLRRDPTPGSFLVNINSIVYFSRENGASKCNFTSDGLQCL